MKKQALITYNRKSKSRYQKRSRDRYAKYFESLVDINGINYTIDARNDQASHVTEITYHYDQIDYCSNLSDDCQYDNMSSISGSTSDTCKSSCNGITSHRSNRSRDPYLEQVINHFPYWEMNIAEQAYHIMVADIKNHYPLGISDMDYLRELRKIVNHLTSDW